MTFGILLVTIPILQVILQLGKEPLNRGFASKLLTSMNSEEIEDIANDDALIVAVFGVKAQ